MSKQQHLNHPFYKDVETYREDVRIGQIIKGSEKYPEPFTTSSWTNDEIVEHAMQENVDQAHYIYAAKERMDELQRKVDRYEKALYALHNIALESEADVMTDITTDVLTGYELNQRHENDAAAGKNIIDQMMEESV